MSGSVWVKSGRVMNLFPEPGVTTAVTGQGVYKDAPKSTFQFNLTGTGALTATVVIEVSNDNVLWAATVLGTATLSGTTSVCDGFTSDAPWKYVRARVSVAPTGTNATVQVYMGV